MKVTFRKTDAGLSIYVAKKDLEAMVTKHDNEGAWGGTFEIENSLVLYVPPMDAEPDFPQTINAKVLSK
ncbi:putative nitrogen fixation protein NifT [Limisalsivibrio acetivorans]|uniref:putative nitrogen fixation protein NifT n=1 Tax=Limisalsivibrio acetivorans TaxID=1304888 RepID=UPI0003B73DCE|nr:putative nitrogen fixation protein NifT [Limisalsivibrio acetivorans]